MKLSNHYFTLLVPNAIAVGSHAFCQSPGVHFFSSRSPAAQESISSPQSQAAPTLPLPFSSGVPLPSQAATSGDGFLQSQAAPPLPLPFSFGVLLPSQAAAGGDGDNRIRAAHFLSPNPGCAMLLATGSAPHAAPGRRIYIVRGPRCRSCQIPHCLAASMPSRLAA
ncbi:hypothetical protein GUJ93_ZPchr0013g36278 [Zizania palustris]|uniref:Uncharacterized protein n=1 Tax=Zizania palustris TaxID=103762 RepID=A0A8J6BU09_ZIZPA|nr:hypothetical protein GUJ93_ZPchr0013g36278 [Zizania palustris]